MRPTLVAALAVIAATALADAAAAHGSSRIHKMLAGEGFEDVDIRGKSSPFYVYACRNNDRYRMYFDYRGNRIEEVVLGPCEEDVETYPKLSETLPGEIGTASESSGNATEKPSKSRSTGTPVKAAPRKDIPTTCRRFVPAIGAVVEVACE